MTAVAKAAKLPERTNLRFARRKKGVSRGEARYGSTKVEAERAKLNDGDVGLQDECPKPTGAKKA